ncbi:MAG: ATP-binding protein [Paludibacteraceae bacterium]|nr:ATP-binding protein [Paludibacteraceae bacterium]
MRRKIYNKLLDWKRDSNGRSAIMIEGARRIGKSYIVEEFAKNEYESYILVDFNHISQDELDLFEHYLSNTEEFLRMLQLHHGVQLVEHKSCIIFDEVQQYPKARAAIKYLVSDGRYDYIETGSLIRIKKNVKGIVIPSEETSLKMFPMDFEEFLWAIGDEMTMPYIEECYNAEKPLGPIHRKTMEKWRLYMVIGGMPQVVRSWVETGDFRKAEAEKRTILNLYENDIHQYATGAEAKAVAIFEDLPGQLQRHDRYFQMSDLGPNARYINYESAFFWLRDSAIVNICWNTTEPSVGLKLNTDRTRLKCYMGDTGLFISMAFDENGEVPTAIYEKILLGKLEANLGMVVENMVAQMLKAKDRRLYFYTVSETEDKEDRMEIDFLIAKSKITSRHNICPIEVKSGRQKFTTASLKKFNTKYHEQLHTSLVLYDGDVQKKDGFTYLPLYMTPLL